MTRRLALAVLLLLIAAPARARHIADEDWDQNGFKMYGIPLVPDRASGAVSLQFVTPGAGLLKATSMNGSIVNAVTNVDYVTPSFTLGGDLGGTPTSANVIRLLETGGPTHLPIGAIPTGGFLQNVGGNVVGTTTLPLSAFYTTSVANVAALEALPGSGYRDGTPVFVQSFGANFVYRASSTLSVNHETVASVSGVGGARWVREIGRNLFWDARTTWYLNPSAGNNENDGASSGAALKTCAELTRRLDNAFFPSGTVTVNVTADVPQSDPCVFHAVTSDGFATVRIVGSTTSIATGRTVSGAHNPASITANDHYEITDVGGVAGYVQNYLLHRTSGTPAYAWGYKDLGSNRLQTSVPMTAAGAATTWANGDTFNVEDPVDFADVIVEPASSGGFVVFELVTVRLLGATSVGAPAPGGAVFMDRVVIQNANTVLYNVGIDAPSLKNVMLPASAGGITLIGRWSAVGGLYAGAGTLTGIFLSDGYALGGNNIPLTLGGIYIDLSHNAIFEKIQVMAYDWTGPSAVVNVSHLSDATITTLGGERNTGKLVAVDGESRVYGDNFTNWNSAITTDPNPYNYGGTSYAQSDLGLATNKLVTRGSGIINPQGGAWSEDLQGDGLDPHVIAIHSGATRFPIGALANGDYLTVVGGSIVGSAAAGLVPTSRTLTPDIGILIDGGTVAVDLSANRTIGARFDNVTITATGGGALQVAAQTGNVTKPAGSNVTALVSIPNDVAVLGDLLANVVPAPSTPGAGTARVYVDVTSKNLAVKSDAGTVNHGAQTFTAPAHQFATALSNAGGWTTAQPGYSDLSGSVPAITATTGDVVATGPGSVPATIQANAVDNTKLNNMPTATIKGRVSAGTGDPEDLTGTQATTLLDTFSSVKGLVPASPGGATLFLNANGGWSTPSGSASGTVTTVTGTAPIVITSTPTATPNVTIQGALVSGSTSTAAQNLGLLTTGLLKGTVSGGVSTISTGVAGTDYAAPFTVGTGIGGPPVLTANISTGVVGGQTAIGGTAAGNNLTLSSTSNATKGKIVMGTSAYDEANNRLGIKTSTPAYALDVNGDANVGGALSVAGNETIGGNLTLSGSASFINMPNADSTGATTDGWITSAGRNLLGMSSGNVTMLNASIAAGGKFMFVTAGSVSNSLMEITNAGAVSIPAGDLLFTKAGTQLIEKRNGQLFIGTRDAFTTGIYTNNITRASWDAAGNMTQAVLGANGTTGMLRADAGVIKTAALPAADMALFSGGTTGTPTAYSSVMYDSAHDLFELSDDARQAWYGIGSGGTGTYQRVRQSFGAGTFVLTSEASGAAVPDIKIDASSAALILAGAVARVPALAGGGFVTATAGTGDLAVVPGPVSVTLPFVFDVFASGGTIGDSFLMTASQVPIAVGGQEYSYIGSQVATLSHGELCAYVTLNTASTGGALLITVIKNNTGSALTTITLNPGNSGPACNAFTVSGAVAGDRFAVHVATNASVNPTNSHYSGQVVLSLFN